LTSKQQHLMTIVIKRARVLALLPFLNNENWFDFILVLLIIKENLFDLISLKWLYFEEIILVLPVYLHLLVHFIFVEKQSLSNIAICASILRFKSTWFSYRSQIDLL
jgi:hypothetical protein